MPEFEEYLSVNEQLQQQMFRIQITINNINQTMKEFN